MLKIKASIDKLSDSISRFNKDCWIQVNILKINGTSICQKQLIRNENKNLQISLTIVSKNIKHIEINLMKEV